VAQAKKRRKVRKKKRSIADELQPLEDAGADDRGSRKDAAKARRERQEDGARDDKRQRGYDAAMDKAMASSRFSSEMDGLSWDPEEREAEAQSLARARQLTSKAESGLAMGLDAVKEQVERAKTAQAAAAEVAGGDDDEAGGGVGADVLSFSVTGEFCKAVTTDHLKQKAAAAKARAAAAEQVLEGSEDEDETEQSSSGWLAAGGEAIGDIKPTKKAAPLPVLPVAAQKAMTVEPMASSGVVAALEVRVHGHERWPSPPHRGCFCVSLVGERERTPERGWRSQLARSKGMLRDVEREEKAFGRTNDMKWQRTQEADEEKVEVARRAEELVRAHVIEAPCAHCPRHSDSMHAHHSRRYRLPRQRALAVSRAAVAAERCVGGHVWGASEEAWRWWQRPPGRQAPVRARAGLERAPPSVSPTFVRGPRGSLMARICLSIGVGVLPTSPR
jgi:hypothetical protein